MEEEKTLLEHATPEVVDTTELDTIREESAELIRDNKRRKFELDLNQAVDDLAFVEKQKLDPKCIYALHGDFTKLCQKDIPKTFGKALLCPFHNSKCTHGVTDSVLKKAYVKYRYGKKDQQLAFSALAAQRQQVLAADNVVNGMSQLAVQPEVQVQPQAQLQVVKREPTLNVKTEAPKLTEDKLVDIEDNMEKEKQEKLKLGKHFNNLEHGLPLRAHVDSYGIASAIGRLKEIVDLENVLPADQILPAMRKYVQGMREQRALAKTQQKRGALVEPPRPAGVTVR